MARKKANKNKKEEEDEFLLLGEEEQRQQQEPAQEEKGSLIVDIPNDDKLPPTRIASFTERTHQNAAESPHSLPFGLKEESWVDAVAPLHDDPSMPTFTLRAFIIGSIWAIFLSCANTLFSFRKNHFRIPVGVVVLLAYPMGLFLEVILPNWKVFGIPLNPSLFSIKEHVLVTIIAASAGGRPHAVDNVVVQASEQYLNDPTVGIWNSIAWVIITQMIGFGLSGILRDFLVHPPSMIWPTVLPEIALFTSFHKQRTVGADHDGKSPSTTTKGMDRMTCFWLVFLGIFIWQWVPQYFMMSLQLVSTLCFFSSNRIIRILGSGDTFEGPGVMGLSFDYSVFDHHNPLSVPLWASVNFFVHSLFWSWLVTPLIYFYNPFNTPPLQSRIGWDNQSAILDPFPVLNSNLIYDRYGQEISMANFANAGGGDPVAIQREIDDSGPFFLSPIFIVSYICAFMNIASVISHVGLWYGSDLVLQTKAAWKASFTDKSTTTDGWDDVHNRLMSKYTDVPGWAYIVWLVFFTVCMILVTSFTPFKMPIWATLLAIFIGGGLSLPIGIISAVSGSRMGLNVLTELIVGYLLPGDIVAVMTFKSVGFNCMIQCLHLLRDLKVSHYMHLSPIAVVAGQIYGTLLGGVCATLTVFWTMDKFKEELTEPGGIWASTSYRSFAVAGEVWGTIGTARFFGPVSPYHYVMWSFLIGFILPFIPWLLDRQFPSKLWILINVPLLTLGNHPGNNQGHAVVPMLLSWVFNGYIFKHYRVWWSKYNFVIAAALSSGSAVATLIIIFWKNVGSDGTYSIWAGSPSKTVPLDYYCSGNAYNGGRNGDYSMRMGGHSH